MTKSATGRGEVNIRLIHNGSQPGKPLLEEPLAFGLQDSKGDILRGTSLPAGLQRFDVVLTLKENGEGYPIFSGKFAHGASTDRFLYLSWKREGAPLWGWRIKIPLAGIDRAKVRDAEKPSKCIAANVVGRKPHTSEPVIWRVEAL